MIKSTSIAHALSIIVALEVTCIIWHHCTNGLVPNPHHLELVEVEAASLEMAIASLFLRRQTRRCLFRVTAWSRSQSTVTAAGRAACDSMTLFIISPTHHYSTTLSPSPPPSLSLSLSLTLSLTHTHSRIHTHTHTHTHTHIFIKFPYKILCTLTAAAAPEVYTVIPPQPLEKKPGQLEQWQLEQFFDKGFVCVPTFFSKTELQPVLKVKCKKTSTS